MKTLYTSMIAVLLVAPHTSRAQDPLDEVHARFDLLEQLLEAETALAANTEAQATILEAFESLSADTEAGRLENPLADSHVTSVSCGDSFCRLEVEHGSQRAFATFADRFGLFVPWNNQQAHRLVSTDPMISEVFVSLEGFTLPEADATRD